MTLARTALRLATVAALQGADSTHGPTIACNRVYDSRIDDFSPETYSDDAKPTVIILTDEDDGDSLSKQNGGPPFRRHIKLVIEFAMVQGFDMDTGSGGTAFVPGYPATDAEHEASLDFLEFQIAQRLAQALDALPILWRKMARPWKHDCHRQVLDDSGVKVAARVLTWDCEVSDDQLQTYVVGQDNIPTGFDIFPEPMRSVAYALPSGSSGFKIATAMANALSPITAGALNGIDFTYDEGTGDPNDMFDVTMEIRSALSVPQIVAAGSATIDYSKGTFQNLILSGNVTSISVINWPPTGKTGRLILQITNTGSFQLTGWPSTEWVGGTPPTITQGAGKKDIVVLTTASSGTEVFGNVVGQDYH